MSTALRQPIWVVGMHRSGTSLVSRILEDLGVFMGWRKEQNHESLFFLELNQHILGACGAAWDHPEPIRWLERVPAAVDRYVEHLRADTSSWRAVEYWGPTRYLRRHRSLWGWKDPRMSILGWLWLRVFEAPRIVRVIRNGVDVAASLQARERELLGRDAGWLRTRWRKRRVGGRSASVRCLRLSGGYSLWEHYLRSEERWIPGSGAPLLELRYEDVLQRPRAAIEELARFLELAPTPAALDAAAGRVRTGVPFGFVEDPRLARFHDRVKERPLMSRYGYAGAIPG